MSENEKTSQDFNAWLSSPDPVQAPPAPASPEDEAAREKEEAKAKEEAAARAKAFNNWLYDREPPVKKVTHVPVTDLQGADPDVLLLRRGSLPLDENGQIGPSTVVRTAAGEYAVVPSFNKEEEFYNIDEIQNRYNREGGEYAVFDSHEDALAWQAAKTSKGGQEKILAQLLLSRGVSLEEQRRVRELAEKYGVPETEIASYLKEYLEDRNVADLLSEHEQLLAYAAMSPKNAAIARENLPELLAVAQTELYERANKQWASQNRPELKNRRTAGLGDYYALGEQPLITSELGYRKMRKEDTSDLEKQLRDLNEPLQDVLFEDEGLTYWLGKGVQTLPVQFDVYEAGIEAAGLVDAAIIGGSTAIGGIFGGIFGEGGGALPGAKFGFDVGVQIAKAVGKTAALTGMATRTYQIEKGNFMNTLYDMRDSQGKALPDSVIESASTIYAVFAASIETLSDAVLLRLMKPFLGSFTMGMSKEALQKYAQEAVLAAAKDKNIWKKLAVLAGRLGKASLTEGGEEVVQQLGEIFATVGAARESNIEAGTSFDTNLPKDMKDQLKESFVGGAAGGAFLGGGMVVIPGIAEIASTRAAAKYAEKHNLLHKLIETAKGKVEDPRSFAEALVAANPELGETVLLPLAPLVTLYHQGVDCLTPIGVDIKTAEKDAAAGEVIQVRTGDMHAFYSTEQFEAASSVMIKDPQAGQAADASKTSELVVDEVSKSIDSAVQKAAEASNTSHLTEKDRKDFEVELGNLENALKKALDSNPNFRAQNKVSGYRLIGQVMTIVRREALALARRTGKKPKDVVYKIYLREDARIAGRRAELSGDIKKQLKAEAKVKDIDNELNKPSESQEEGSEGNTQGDGSEGQEGGSEGQNGAPEDNTSVTEDGSAPSLPKRPERVIVSSLPKDSPKNKLEVGGGKTYDVSFEIWELEDLVASHDPENNFQRRADYPPNVQERAYQSVRSEQDKVRTHAMDLKPHLLLTNDPSPQNGPPVITPEGIVLGGNSRVMTMQLAFKSSEKLAAYRDALKAEAQSYGFDPESFSGMKCPVLVRTVQNPMTTTNEMAIASNTFNQTMTEDLDLVAEGISKSRRIDAGMLRELSEGMTEFDSLREFLGNKKSKSFVQRLIEKEIIAPNQVGRLVDAKTGMLNALGKIMVESVLRGLIIPDYDILSDVTEDMASVIRKLDKALLPLMRLKFKGAEWDVSPFVVKALKQIMKAKATMKDFRLADMPAWFAQLQLTDMDPDRELTSVRVLALLLADNRVTQKEVAARFGLLADLCGHSMESMGVQSLVETEKIDYGDAFIQSFMGSVATVGGTPVQGFNVVDNPDHAAMQWVADNAPRGTVSKDLINDVIRKGADQSLTEADRVKFQELKAPLMKLLDAGAVNVFEPKYLARLNDWNGRKLFQVAYHGTAARFETFSTDFMRSGEGALAHGWGLYFARKRKVAEGYRAKLIENKNFNKRDVVTISFKGKKIYKKERQLYTLFGSIADKKKIASKMPLTDAQIEILAAAIDDMGYYSKDSVDEFIDKQIAFHEEKIQRIQELLERENQSIDKLVAKYGTDRKRLERDFVVGYKKDINKSTEIIKELKKMKEDKSLEIKIEGPEKLTGQVFKVDIPDDDVLFEEGDRLSSQLKTVKKGLMKFIENPVPLLFHSFFYIEKNEDGTFSLSKNYGNTNTEKSGKEIPYWIDLTQKFSSENEAYEKGKEIINRIYSQEELQNIKEYFARLVNEDPPGWKFLKEIWYKAPFDKRAISLALNEAGIKGITYVGRQDGRCFVVFDDKTVTVLKTFYQGELDVFKKGQLMTDAEILAHGNPRGAVTDNGTHYIIDLFKSADVSTIIHEMSHVFFMEMEKAINNGTADESLKRDFEILRKWVGCASSEHLTDEQHEKLARGMEAYFMEGKAPISSLRSVFASFSKWMQRIYVSIVNLNVQLTDEVRGVFDRMLIAEQEVEQDAIAHNLTAITPEMQKTLGISDSQLQYLNHVNLAAREAAAAELINKRNEERPKRLKLYRKQAEREVKEMKIYQALRDMKKKPLSAAMVVQIFGYNTTLHRIRLRHGIEFAAENGEDPTAFAAMHRFGSVEEMLNALAEAPTEEEAIQEIVDRLDREYDEQFESLKELITAPEQAQFLALVGNHLAHVMGRAYVQDAAIARAADRLSEKKGISELSRMHVYMRNVKTALARQRKALLKGDTEAAFDANCQARINLELARRAKEYQKDINKIARLIKVFMKAKKHREVTKYALMAFASLHGFMPVNRSLAEKYTAEDVNAWQRELLADGMHFAVDLDQFTSDKSWREMTPQEFDDFKNVVIQIVELARRQEELLATEKATSLEEAVNEITESVARNNPEPKEQDTVNDENKLLASLKDAHAFMMKIEELCIQLDGGKVGGPMWKYIYKPINDAEDRQVLRLKKERTALRALFEKFFSRRELAKMQVAKVHIKEIGQALTLEQRICVALNMGNEVNQARLRSGHNWTDEQIYAIVQTLTEKEWQFVQAIWDHLATFRPEAFAMEEKLTGVRPREVKAQAFKVRTADGKEIELRGGYYPIRYNPRKSSLAAIREEKKYADELFGGQTFAHAMTEHGHLKERSVQGIDNAPLLLSLGVIPEHIYQVVHDLCYRPAVIDVSRIIRNPKFRATIEAYGGRELFRLFRPWLVDIANEHYAPLTALNKFAYWMRTSATVLMLGFKCTTMFAQVCGITQSVDVLGSKYTGNGLLRVVKSLKHGFRGIREFIDLTNTKSAFMAGRLETFDRDLRDTTKMLNRGTLTSWTTTIQRWSFKPMAYFQYIFVDLPTWWGAYEKASVEMKADDETAISYADSVVRQTQGSGSPKDLSAVQRGNDVQRLLTMFYHYFNVLYNLGARRIKELKADHSPAGIARAGMHMMLLWILPAVMTEFMAGRWGGDEDKDSTASWLAKLLLAYPLQTVVGVRDIVNAAGSYYGYQLTPGESVPKSIVKMMKSVEQAIKKEDPSLMVKPTIEAAFYVFKLPGGQAEITASNLYDYFTEPGSEFYVRDLFFKKPRERGSNQVFNPAR